jgi:hypothetical protein
MKKYTFIKLKKSNVWLFVAKNPDDVRQHYLTYCAPIIKEGTSYIIDKYVLFKPCQHPTNMFASAFQGMKPVFDLNGIKTIPEMLAKLEIEIQTARESQTFPIYLFNNLKVYGGTINSEDVYEKNESEKLIYPDDINMDIDDVRYLQWKGGTHWYAKIGKMDVTDENGNQKWNTRKEAENASKCFIQKVSGKL